MIFGAASSPYVIGLVYCASCQKWRAEKECRRGPVGNKLLCNECGMQVRVKPRARPMS